MTGRVQNLRSATTGNRPPAGRQPGEIYVNWADGQLGTINAASANQDLIAVTYFSTNANYVVGQHVLQGGFLYRCIATVTAGAFNATQWAQVTTNGLPITGGTMTGALTLASDPTVSLQAATKHYVDSNLVSGGAQNPNLLINGAMRIVQANGGIVGAIANPGLYVLDHWWINNNTANTTYFECGRNLGGPPGPFTPPAGFNYWFQADATTVVTPAAGDILTFSQWVEGDLVREMLWGSASAKPVTLSFWVNAAPGASTFSVSITNSARNRSYAIGYTVTANTWTLITMTFPGDTGGTWVTAGNGIGLILNFSLSIGATHTATAPITTWINGTPMYAVQGNYNISLATTAFLAFTGVKLEVGGAATPYVRQTLASELQDCQRYYAKTYGQPINPGTGGNLATALAAYVGPTADTTSSLGANWLLPVTMRTQPTVVLYSPNSGTVGKAYMATAAADVNAGSPIAGDCNVYLALSGVSVSARDVARFHATANAETSISLT